MHIARPGQWPSALVLFSMGILPPFRGLLKDGHLSLPYVFVDHSADMVTKMRRDHSREKFIRMYAQTERPKGAIERMLTRLGFTDTGIISGDGYPFWEMEVELPHTESRDLLNLPRVWGKLLRSASLRIP